MRDSREGVTPTRCPFCDTYMDASTVAIGDDDASPTPGDVSVCLYCARVSVYDEDGTLRKPTLPESIGFAEDRDIQRARAAAIKTAHQHGLGPK